MKRFLPLMIGVFLLLQGCNKRERHLPFPYLPGAKQVGTSVEGRPIEALVLGSGPETVLIIATIHGNEFAGRPLLQQMTQFLRTHKDLLQVRRVVLLPIANPDGYVHNVRTNSHSIDLNRNFGASNRQDLKRYGTELSEPESALIAALLKQYKPARIVSIHQPLSCIDYDGPAEELAQLMAKYCELPVKLVGSRPGSLGSYAGVDLGIPIVTLELPRRASSLTAPEVWRRYGVALLASITYPAQPVLISAISPLGVVALFAALGCLAVVLLVLVRRKNRSRGAV